MSAETYPKSGSVRGNIATHSRFAHLTPMLEFMAVIDYPLPQWARDYMAAMETALGKAYVEPVVDVRG